MNVAPTVSSDISSGLEQKSSQPLATGPADPRQVDMFRASLEQERTGSWEQASGMGDLRGSMEEETSLKTGQRTAGEDTLPQDAERGETLSSLFSTSFSGMGGPLDGLFSGKAENIASPVSIMEDGAMEQLVERILVSAPSDGSREVRLTLGGDRLAGTEVILNRASDGSLSITLTTNSASSFQTLVSARDDLKHALELHEGQDVRVDIDHDRGGESNDSDRRSRGWMPEDLSEL